MKYITKEMWPGTFGINENDDASKFLSDLWESRLCLCREELNAVKDRIGVDDNLLSFEVVLSSGMTIFIVFRDIVKIFDHLIYYEIQALSRNGRY
ncbi:MAG: hypothetical protein LBG97_05755 [Coriobacteriales bacterium]|nr:hypothetical protein [Coriobacteriales bacterium]